MADAQLAPWLQPAWQQLVDYRRQDRLPQAMLWIGPSGIGKRQLAERWATSLLCQQPHSSGTACGVCSSCQWLVAGSHPDYRVVDAEEGKALTIERIRELSAKLALASQCAGGWRVVILDPADALNTAASNALLKTLEEPPPLTLLLLISARPSRIAATLISRCQRLTLRAPSYAEAQPWLAQQRPDLDYAAAWAATGGAPLRCLNAETTRWIDQRRDLFALYTQAQRTPPNIVQAAERLTPLGVERIADWLYGWCMDVLRLTQGLPGDTLYSPDTRADLHTAGLSYQPQHLAGLIDEILSCKRAVLENAQLNRTLILERLLLTWLATAPKSAR